MAHRTTLLLDEETRAAARELARQYGVSVSEAIRRSLSRGPRTAEQLAVARAFIGDDGILPFSEEFASKAAEVFRALGSPRKRAADIAIAVTAAASGALLLTRNEKDFAGVPGLTVETVG